MGNSRGRVSVGREIHAFRVKITRRDRTRDLGSKLVLAFGEEKLAGAFVIGFRHEDVGGAGQITVVRRGGVNELLCGGDAVFFQHHHQQFRFDDRAGEEQFHAGNLAANTRERTWINPKS